MNLSHAKLSIFHHLKSDLFEAGNREREEMIILYYVECFIEHYSIYAALNVGICTHRYTIFNKICV